MFDEFDIAVRQRFCEALYAAGCIKEAGESLLNIVNNVDEDIYITGLLVGYLTLSLRDAFDISPQISCDGVPPPPKVVLIQPSSHIPHATLEGVGEI